MESIIASVNDIVWGAPALVMILGVGLYLSWKLGFAQILFLPEALKRFFCQFFSDGKDAAEGSSFRALCTALAATVGTGNLVGVAGAICLGGPGSIFWMWICGLLGMVTKYAEATLAVHFRIRTPDGYTGGPMYLITKGLPKGLHFLAYGYAFFGVVASFGVGNITQIHAAVSGCREFLSVVGREPGSNFALGMSFVLAIVIGIFFAAERSAFTPWQSIWCRLLRQDTCCCALVYFVLTGRSFLVPSARLSRVYSHPQQSQAGPSVRHFRLCGLAAAVVSLPMKQVWEPHPLPMPVRNRIIRCSRE